MKELISIINRMEFFCFLDAAIHSMRKHSELAEAPPFSFL
jgi:hypothetical protein